MLTCTESSDECSSVIEASASEYLEFGKFDATKDSSGQESKSSESAGVEASYGLMKSSLKLAFKQQHSSSSSTGTIEKKIGLVNKRTYYLPYDSQGGTKELNQHDRQLTADALLHSSVFLKKSIEQITRAY